MPRIKLPATIDHLEMLIEFVTACSRENGFTGKKIKEIELATEEALVNIFNYAYPEGAGEVELSCRPEDAARLIVDISDNGIPFNMLSLPGADVTSDISNREIGGLGVFFIREMVDEVYYHRDGNKNILTFIFSKS